MLKEKPGCYIWLGNGTGLEGGCMVHNPHYDFNDEILPLGASYWAAIGRKRTAGRCEFARISTEINLRPGFQPTLIGLNWANN